MNRRRLRLVVFTGAACIAVGLLIAVLAGLPATAPAGPARYTEAFEEEPSRVLGWLLLVGGLALASGLLGYLLGARHRPVPRATR